MRCHTGKGNGLPQLSLCDKATKGQTSRTDFVFLFCVVNRFWRLLRDWGELPLYNKLHLQSASHLRLCSRVHSFNHLHFSPFLRTATSVPACSMQRSIKISPTIFVQGLYFLCLCQLLTSYRFFQSRLRWIRWILERFLFRPWLKSCLISPLTTDQIWLFT